MKAMSKYDPLWRHIKDQTADTVTMSFDGVAEVLGFEIDHSFLTYKKELLAFGWSVGKISLKNRTVVFLRQP